MAKSQNGWSVLEDRPPSVAVPYIDYEVKFAVRPGDVAVVLLEVARRFHNEVQGLDLPGERDEWGWAYRPIRGKESGFSNHASGTAIDLNATRLPRGVKATDVLSATQISRCRAIRSSMHDEAHGGSIVRWGGDYTGTPDSMHWEITDGVSEASLHRVANRVRAKWEELEEENMDDATIEKIAKRTAAVLLSTDIEGYLDKNKDGKRDVDTVGRMLAGALAEGYVGRVLEQAPEPGVEELKTEVASLKVTVTELVGLVHQLVEGGTK